MRKSDSLIGETKNILAASLSRSDLINENLINLNNSSEDKNLNDNTKEPNNTIAEEKTEFLSHKIGELLQEASALNSNNLISQFEEEQNNDDNFNVLQTIPTDTVICLVGLSEGLTHLASLAIFYLFKDDNKLSPSLMSAVMILPAIPWFCRPLFAFMSDNAPFFGYRRKSYLILSSLIQSVGYFVLALIGNKLIFAAISLLLISIGSAMCSALIEALIVEKNNNDSEITNEQGSWPVTKLVGFKSIGSLLTAYFSGSLLETFDKKYLFICTAFFPLIITIVSFFMIEKKLTPLQISVVTDRNNLKKQLLTIIEFVKQKIIWGPSLFVFLFMCSPDYDDALFYYYINVLGFSPTFMGYLRLTYGISAILGIIIYQSILVDKSYKVILMSTTIICLSTYIMPVILVYQWNKKIGISDKIFVLSGGFLLEAIAEIQLLPLLVYSSLVCPPGLEGSIYSIIMSTKNLGSAFSKLLSSVFIYCFGITHQNFDHLAEYIIFCTLCSCFPLFLMDLIPHEKDIVEFRRQCMILADSSQIK